MGIFLVCALIDNEQNSVQNRLGAIYFILIAQMFANSMNVVLYCMTAITETNSY
jgi:hypothetical protein